MSLNRRLLYILILRKKDKKIEREGREFLFVFQHCVRKNGRNKRKLYFHRLEGCVHLNTVGAALGQRETDDTN
jgi:hypothetical protein